MISAQERRNIILQLLAERGSVTVAELYARFNVSEVTIRRDLTILESSNLLRRIHGGAVTARGRSYEPPFLTRNQESIHAKECIGKYAATLVNDGDSVVLDVGTTTLAMARNMVNLRDITVLTASLPIANVLADRPDIRVLVSGGFLRPGEQSMVGSVAAHTFTNYFVDKAFLGIGGVDLEVGLTEYNAEDAEVKRNLVQGSQQRILLADSTKFGRRTFSRVARLEEIDEIVTDDSIDEGIAAELEKLGIRMHLVSVNVKP